MARSDRKRIALAATIALAVPAVVACNGIIGLDDYEKVECPGRRCADAATPPDVGQPDVVNDAPPEARGTDPVSWPQWPMPNYDGGADFLPNQLKYNVLDKNRIEDATTKLVWRRATLAQQVPIDDARQACAELDPATGPWRMPKRIELVSVLDFGRPAVGGAFPPLIDPLFDGVKKVRVWTSSELRDVVPFVTANAYWTVDFGTGAVDTLTVSSSDVASVLCVRGK